MKNSLIDFPAGTSYGWQEAKRETRNCLLTFLGFTAFIGLLVWFTA